MQESTVTEVDNGGHAPPHIFVAPKPPPKVPAEALKSPERFVNPCHSRTLRQLYSVISIPTMGKMAKNRKVKESAETVWLNMVSKGASLRSAAGCNSRSAEKCGGKTCLWEGIVKKDHGTNETAAGRTIGVSVLKAGTPD